MRWLIFGLGIFIYGVSVIPRLKPEATSGRIFDADFMELPVINQDLTAFPVLFGNPVSVRGRRKFPQTNADRNHE